jgi:hypothetical protein
MSPVEIFQMHLSQRTYLVIVGLHKVMSSENPPDLQLFYKSLFNHVYDSNENCDDPDKVSVQLFRLMQARVMHDNDSRTKSELFLNEVTPALIHASDMAKTIADKLGYTDLKSVEIDALPYILAEDGRSEGHKRTSTGGAQRMSESTGSKTQKPVREKAPEEWHGLCKMSAARSFFSKGDKPLSLYEACLLPSDSDSDSD